MSATPLRERVGDNHLDEMDTDSVRSVFRHDSLLTRLIEARSPQGQLLVLLTAVAMFIVVFVFGFALGGGFSPSATAPANGGLYITTDQAARYDQQTAELDDLRSQLDVAQGETAFYHSQLTFLQEDEASLRSALNEARLEMTIIVGIYEECVDRLYPLECIESARPEAEAFLADLYDSSK
jgi:hypothetical protein